MSKTHSFPNSLSYAWTGLKTALKNEPNIKIQGIIGFLAVIAAFFFRFSQIEWLILLITVFLVLILELINTTLEALVDLVSPQIQEKARIAKDVSAAVVLISAAFSILVGCFLFLPKIIIFLSGVK